MKDNEITNLKKQIKKRKNKKTNDYRWIIRISVISFIISIVFSTSSELLIPNVPLFVGIILLIVFISIGILFDMIGMSVASANEKVFHSMNSRKVKGADIAVNFKKNASKVSTFCNDVIGDVSGIVSGSVGVIISSSIANKFNFSLIVTTLVVTGIISAITIGGKAIFKSYAINKSDLILYEFSKFVSNFYHLNNNKKAKK